MTAQKSVSDPPIPHLPRAPFSFDAIIVAGGRGSRLGGVDKPALRHSASTLLDLAVSAVVGAERICVVGPERSLLSEVAVQWAIEEPRGGGPSAALGAGIRALTENSALVTLVLAADLVRPTDAVSALLAQSIPDAAAGVVAIDGSGRRQPLLAVYRTADLTAALEARSNDAATPLDGLALRRLLAGLALHEVPLPDALCADIDTPDDAIRYGIRLPAGDPGAWDWLA